MILTIDLNPAVDEQYFLEEIPLKGNVDAKSFRYSPGGSGIKIARLLDIFNENTLITGFLGGVSGEFYHRRLVESGIGHRIVNIKDDIRTRLKIVDENNNKIIISSNKPRVTREEMVQFYELYSETIDDFNIIIASGTLPQGIDTDIYFDLINLANKKEKIFILDGVGEELLKGIDASPYIVIISKEELENLVNLSLNFENEIIKAGKFILDKGVKILVINLYEKGIIVLEESTGYRLDFPNVDVDMEELDNAGIVAGLALGISRKYDFEMTLKLSQAFSVVYAMEEDINKLEMSDVKRFMGEIDIYPINH